MPGSSHISERGIVWWMNAGSGTAKQQRMKKRNGGFITSADIKSKSTGGAARFGDDFVFYLQVLASREQNV